MAKNWNKGTWKGKDNYECKHCPYSTLDREEIVQHYNEKHAPAPKAPEPVKATIYDRFGNRITHHKEV